MDPWCHKNCNPQDVRDLDGVNTPVCEQLFSTINQYRNAKAMNEGHFFLFFIYLFDLHNLNIEGKLRSVANPNSMHRFDMISKKCKSETIQAEKSFNAENPLNSPGFAIPAEPAVDEMIDQIEGLSLKTNYEKVVPSDYKCNLCNSTYQKLGNLKNHMSKKHAKEEISVKSYSCSDCGGLFDNAKSFSRHCRSYHMEIVCGFCQEICCDKLTYDNHLKIHLKCKVCDIVFDKPFKLERHQKKHS